MNQSFWDEIVQGTQTSALDFVEAMLKAEAGNWGNTEDFWVLEEEGKPVAAAGYAPSGAYATIAFKILTASWARSQGTNK